MAKLIAALTAAMPLAAPLALWIVYSSKSKICYSADR